MRLFIKSFIFFIIPLLIWLIIEGLLPITTFTFRHHEAVTFQTMIPKVTANYPNINSKMNAVGDLCHHTDKAIIKEEIWKTDKLGFRNNAFIEEADILFVGDSFIEGSGLSQEETITNKVALKLGSSIKVYNMAQSSMSEFDKLLKCSVIKKPKLLIFSSVERYLPSEIIYYHSNNSNLKTITESFLNTSNLNVLIDKALKHYSIDWIKARINHSTGLGVPAIGDTKMFFLKGVNNKHQKTDIKTTSNIIISYKKYCDSLGINFLFLPMPDKETVYFELVPFVKQPTYLFELDSILSKSGVATMNTLEIYNKFRKQNKILLYHYDDTHWNSQATELISDEIVKIQKGRNH